MTQRGSSKAAQIENLTRSLRATFQELRALGDALHADLGITAAMRAVLERATEGEPETVPQIARAKTVSRQHIQTVAAALAAKDLIAFADNPAHKRSPFVVPTPTGREDHAEMRRREAAILRRLALGFETEELVCSSAVLAKLHREIRTIRKEEETDDTE
ncbi:MAG: MarR family transcriptional regulator [Proteobacteria bacterium]|nr:MarR family transcriptional regulator [Pseudomonadota bacterium]